MLLLSSVVAVAGTAYFVCPEHWLVDSGSVSPSPWSTWADCAFLPGAASPVLSTWFDGTSDGSLAQSRVVATLVCVWGLESGPGAPFADAPSTRGVGWSFYWLDQVPHCDVAFPKKAKYQKIKSSRSVNSDTSKFPHTTTTSLQLDSEKNPAFFFRNDSGQLQSRIKPFERQRCLLAPLNSKIYFTVTHSKHIIWLYYFPS